MSYYVCNLDELAENQPRRVVLDGHPIAVIKNSQGVVHAVGDTCTHGEISLSEGFAEDETLECWAHGSKFSLITGEPLNLPAFEPVPVYEVEIDNNEIYIDPEITISVDAKAGEN